MKVRMRSRTRMKVRMSRRTRMGRIRMRNMRRWEMMMMMIACKRMRREEKVG